MHHIWTTFQRLTDNVLRECLGRECLVYIDDTTVYSVSLQEHIVSLSKVIQKFKESNLEVQLHNIFNERNKMLGIKPSIC